MVLNSKYLTADAGSSILHKYAGMETLVLMRVILELRCA